MSAEVEPKKKKLITFRDEDRHTQGLSKLVWWTAHINLSKCVCTQTSTVGSQRHRVHTAKERWGQI